MRAAKWNRCVLIGLAGLSAMMGLNACARSGDAIQQNAREPITIANLMEPAPDIARRNLLFGVGGRRLQPPDAPFRFVREELGGASRKLDVVDRNGITWNVKFGAEARPEVTASRLLWAVGYRQSPSYFVSQWQLEGGPAPGLQEGARFRPDIGWKVVDHWEWQDNPFRGSQELRALVVFMGLINNWDLKKSQNVVLERPGEDPRQIWIVGDLGATFGGTGWLTHSKDDLADFEEEPLVRGVDGDHVDLALRVGYAREQGLDEDVRVGDVLWLVERLQQLTDEQWLDAFRAGGYSESESAAFVGRLQEKVREGLRLAGPSPPAADAE
jgi:hypothetical protein